MPGGRPRVGEPARELPATQARGPRRATKQTQVRLGHGQYDDVRQEADRLVTSAATIVRRAVDRLLSGQLPRPTRPEDIPAPLPAVRPPQAPAILPVALGAERVSGLERLAGEIGDEILRPDVEPVRTGRRGRPASATGKPADALIRYALAVDLARERAAGPPSEEA
jgi:hypothetical protein